MEQIPPFPPCRGRVTAQPFGHEQSQQRLVCSNLVTSHCTVKSYNKHCTVLIGVQAVLVCTSDKLCNRQRRESTGIKHEPQILERNARYLLMLQTSDISLCKCQLDVLGPRCRGDEDPDTRTSNRLSDCYNAFTEFLYITECVFYLKKKYGR